MTAFESVVEQAAIDQLQRQGYAYLPGVDLAEERGRTTEVFLRDRLRAALARFNEGLSSDAIDDAARRILQPPTASVEDNNQYFHRRLTRGISLEVLGEDGVRGDLAWPVAWDDPDANDWLVTNQLTIRGPFRPPLGGAAEDRPGQEDDRDPQPRRGGASLPTPCGIERRIEKVERLREEMGQPAFVERLRKPS